LIYFNIEIIFCEESGVKVNKKTEIYTFCSRDQKVDSSFHQIIKIPPLPIPIRRGG